MEGGTHFVWVFRVKNRDFMPKDHIFSNFRGGACAGCAPAFQRDGRSERFVFSYCLDA